MNRLEDKVVLVTGGTEGIGRAVALAMRDEGAVVAVTGRSPEKGEKLRAEFGDDQRFAYITADACERESNEGAVDAVVARFGGVDILVNNAGGSPGAFALVGELDDETWNRGLRLKMFR